MTQLSVRHFECLYLETENVPRRQDKSSGLILFGKKAVCPEKQIHNINYVCCRLTLKHTLNVLRAVLYIC